MRIHQYCNNKAVEIEIDSDNVMYFSYHTLMAIRHEGKLYRTVADDEVKNTVSITTSKHMNEMFGCNKKEYSQLPYRKFNVKVSPIIDGDFIIENI